MGKIQGIINDIKQQKIYYTILYKYFLCDFFEENIYASLTDDWTLEYLQYNNKLRKLWVKYSFL